jgi:hypothetical protein
LQVIRSAADPGAVVKGLLNGFDLSAVRTMTVKRLGLGGTVTLEIRGAEIRHESCVGASREFTETLAQTIAARA